MGQVAEAARRRKGPRCGGLRGKRCIDGKGLLWMLASLGRLRLRIRPREAARQPGLFLPNINTRRGQYIRQLRRIRCFVGGARRWTHDTRRNRCRRDGC